MYCEGDHGGAGEGEEEAGEYWCEDEYAEIPFFFFREVGGDWPDHEEEKCECVWPDVTDVCEIEKCPCHAVFWACEICDECDGARDECECDECDFQNFSFFFGKCLGDGEQCYRKTPDEDFTPAIIADFRSEEADDDEDEEECEE